MQTDLTKKNTLIAVAMKEELSLEQADGWNVIYTGIGKVNALISVMKQMKMHHRIGMKMYQREAKLSKIIWNL